MGITETLELKTPEVESTAKEDDDRVVDSEKEAITPETDDLEKRQEKKGEEDDGESEEEEETKKSSVTTMPLSDRPTRKRKKVERYSLPAPFKSSGSKPVSIEKGRGTPLKEIPNVAYKLSKRKPDDNLLLLHTILYGKKAKAQMLKRNIGQFSGFVWSDKEEEKQRARAKDKLEKCIKEKLTDFCDVLDIPVNKSNVKKEELAVLVLEFLVYPKATRDIVLADREQQTRKRKKSTPNTVTSVEFSDVPAKRKRETKKSEKKQDQPSETKEGDVGSEDNSVQEKKRNHKDNEIEDEKDKTEEKKSSVKKSSSDKTAKDSFDTKDKEKPASEEEKSLVGSAKSSRKPIKQVKKSISSSNKKQKVDQDDDSLKKKSNKQRNQSQARVKLNKKGETDPSRKELRVVVAKILKEVDFNTATLSDILQKLGSHFGVDLMHRKAEVKDIIKDAIDEVSDEENTV